MANKILLDYFFPIASITPTPAASTAFLKQACVVVTPNAGGTNGDITECTSSSEIAAVTDNTEAVKLLDAGLNKVYILQTASLDIADYLAGYESEFFTILISSDFVDADVTDDLDVGAFKGVVGVASSDDSFLETQAAIENRCAFHNDGTNKAQNMMYAFGKLLSNSLSWKNQQYITMPLAEDVTTVGEAETKFDDKISFVIDDGEFGKRLALFACGGQAIVAPYIKRNLEIDIQSKALSFISGNQPNYTVTNAALLEDELQKVVDSYIEKQWIELGTIEVKLEQENFTGSGYINISEPKALWRISGQIQQTL